MTQKPLRKLWNLVGLVVVGLPLCLFVHLCAALESWRDLFDEWRLHP